MACLISCMENRHDPCSSSRVPWAKVVPVASGNTSSLPRICRSRMNTRQWPVGHCPDSFPGILLYRNRPRLRHNSPCVPGIVLFVGQCSGCPVGPLPPSGNTPGLGASRRSVCGIGRDACWSRCCPARGGRHVHSVG